MVVKIRMFQHQDELRAYRSEDGYLLSLDESQEMARIKFGGHDTARPQNRGRKVCCP